MVNQKGIYTALAAFIALVVIAGALFYIKMPMNESSTRATGKNTMEIVAAWQNSRYLYDKAFAEGIGDYLYDYMPPNPCNTTGLSNAGLITEIENYMATIRTYIQTETGFDCIITGAIDNTTPPDITYNNAILKCSNGSKKIELEKAIIITKMASANDPGSGNCRITIRDNQALVDELIMDTSYT